MAYLPGCNCGDSDCPTCWVWEWSCAPWSPNDGILGQNNGRGRGPFLRALGSPHTAEAARCPARWAIGLGAAPASRRMHCDVPDLAWVHRIWLNRHNAISSSSRANQSIKPIKSSKVEARTIRANRAGRTNRAGRGRSQLNQKNSNSRLPGAMFGTTS